MYKLEIFKNTLSAVVEETEIKRELILSSNKQEEVVDARYLLVEIMSEQGLYPTQISNLTGVCVRSVNNFLQGFKTRCNSRKIIRIDYDRVRNKLGLS
jgi:hypothetical protein